MHGHNLVAVYSSRPVAENAKARLIEAGVPASDIRISTDRTRTAATKVAEPRHEGGFLDWLFGEAPEEHQYWYANNLSKGRTALSVYVRGEDQQRIHTILEEFGPVDIDDESFASGTVGLAGSGSAATATSGAAARTTGRETTEREQVIPLAKEELDVGKRQTERRYKVRTYVVERPVEEQVHLRDERVTIERRPASGDRQVGDLQGKEFEVIERREEPVVAKKSRAAEEVVVHKEVADRVETVRDKVRETKVDIDKDGGTAKGKRPVDRAAAGSKPTLATDAEAPIPPLDRKI